MIPPTFTNIPNECHTTVDGKKIFDSRSTAVCVKFQVQVLTNRAPDYPPAEILTLVVRRGEAVDHTGQWCLPCGYLDRAETRRQAAQRELYEETGLYVELEDLAELATDDDPEAHLGNLTTRYGCCAVTNFESHADRLIAGLKFQEGEVTDIRLVSHDLVESMTFAFNHKSLILDHPPVYFVGLQSVLDLNGF